MRMRPMEVNRSFLDEKSDLRLPRADRGRLRRDIRPIIPFIAIHRIHHIHGKFHIGGERSLPGFKRDRASSVEEDNATFPSHTILTNPWLFDVSFTRLGDGKVKGSK